MKTKIQSFETLITPDYAKVLLSGNTKNRNVNTKIIEKYAADMKDSKWVVNGSSITISESGRLLDGQHRLLASIKANISFPSILTTGVEDSAQATIDTGAKRKIANIFQMMGERNTNNLAAALEWLYAYERGVTTREASLGLPASEAVAFLERHSGIKEWIDIGGRCHAIGFLPSAFTFLCYAASRYDVGLTKQFAGDCETGIGLTYSSPIALLRNRVIASKGSLKQEHRHTKLALYIKAWNAFATKKVIKTLRWTPDVEPFPDIYGFPMNRNI